MKKVLIALDFDPTALKVADEGFSMAKAMKAGVILMHVIADATYYSALEYSPITGFSGFMDMYNNQLDSAGALKKVSLNYLNKVKLKLGDKTIKTVVKEGEFADSIIEAAKELKVDTIVMGSHSRRWLEEILIGSVTEKVLHRTTVPILIVPTKQKR